MGLFDVIGGILNPFAWASGKAIGEGARAIAPEAGTDPGAAPSAPTLDPRYEQLRDIQNQRAKAFRGNVPNYAQSQDISRAETGRRELAGALTGIDRSANRRGLLYGGARLADRSAARGELAKSLAEGRAGSNVQMLDTANVLERQPIETGFGMAGVGQEQFSAQQAAEKSALQSALEQRQARGSALSGAAGSLGQAVGKFASAREEKADKEKLAGAK